MTEFFIDSANFDEIREALALGFVSGVTINQSLLAKEQKRPYLDYLAELASTTDILSSAPPSICVSVPVTETSWSGITSQVISIRKISPNFMLKVPVSTISAAAMRKISGVNATCVFTGLQAAVAHAAGAKIISVFVGRVNDQSDGYGYKVLSVAKKHCPNSKILAGSIRSPEMVGAAIEAGADIVTCSLKVLRTLADDQDSAKSAAKFNEDYAEWIS